MLKLDGYWKVLFEEETQKPYFSNLFNFLEVAFTEKDIYPEPDLMFRALELTPWDNIKVVILGQDPYHGEGQADGLAFSVPDRQQIPPSLRNIFKELNKDCDVEIPKSGDLSDWARQGVLLLNTCLTVEASKPTSHQGKGWETFTDAVISACSAIDDRSVCFLLWGSAAQAKAPLIDGKRHMVFKAAHPSPFSAHNGFMGCNHFSKVNSHLVSQGQKPIKWGNVI